MPNKPKQQGTTWETAIVRRFKADNIHAARLPLRGQRGEPDLEVGVPSWDQPLPVVMWKRLVKARGSKKRVPDGEKEVVVLGLDDFVHLYAIATHDTDLDPPRLLVQAKATERLNVTRVLGELRTALKLLF